MTTFFTKYISALLFLLLSISLESCFDREVKIQSKNGRCDFVSDLGPLSDGCLSKSQYRPNMVVRCREKGFVSFTTTVEYSIAAVKLDSFEKVSLDIEPSQRWIYRYIYKYDDISTLDSGNVKIEIPNRDLRVEKGRLVYWPVLSKKWEIDPKNFATVIPGDGMVGTLDENVVSFRVDMRECFFSNVAGDRIYLKKGGSFKASFTVPDSKGPLPDSLSMWHFNETDGKWSCESVAYRKGDVFETDLNSLGWWTSFKHDCKFKKVTFRMLDEFSNPLPYSELTIVSKTTQKRCNISTDMYGVGSVYVDQNESFEVHMHGFSVPTYDSNWPFKESYTRIEYPGTDDLICYIEPGEENVDKEYKIGKDIEATYKDKELSYNELPQHCRLDDETIFDKPSVNDSELDGMEFRSKPNPQKSYPMTILMPHIGGIHYGYIHYAQTFMSKWDTLEYLRIRKSGGITIIPYNSTDTIIAELSKGIISFSVDTFNHEGKELYHLNELVVWDREKLTIKYSTLSAFRKAECDKRYKNYASYKKKDYEFETDVFDASPQLKYEYLYHGKSGKKYIKTRREIGREKRVINTELPVQLRAIGENEKKLKLVSVKDEYDNNVLLNPKYGTINLKALKSGELTFEFEDEDVVYNSAIHVWSLKSKNFTNSFRIKKVLPVLGIVCLIFLLLVFSMKNASLILYVIDYLKKKVFGKKKYADSEYQDQSNANDVAVAEKDEQEREKQESDNVEYDTLGIECNLALLIAHVVNMGPSFDDRHKTMIRNFQLSLSMHFDLVKLVDSSRSKTFYQGRVLMILKPLLKNKNAELMRLLFKIAATDDGIKNDEWKFLIKVMHGLDMNRKLVNRFIKRYSPLRSEEYSYDKSKQSDSSKQSSQSQQSRQSDNSEKKKESSNQKTYYSPNSKYFAVLGLSVDSTSEQVKSAYRILAKIWHPDLPKNADNQAECVRKMAEINVAYEEIMKRFG